ncbi:hypothetical protein [Staphylococcus hominis]|uniref:hypothetical protein n=1 Tax=Staphylococcus hominis TaxID=1290 RepID=UPI00333FF71E
MSLVDLMLMHYLMCLYLLNHSRLLMLMHALLSRSLVDSRLMHYLMCLYLLNHSRLLTLMHYLMCLYFLSRSRLLNALVLVESHLLTLTCACTC